MNRRDFVQTATGAAAAAVVADRLAQVRTAFAQQIASKQTGSSRDSGAVRSMYDLAPGVTYFNHASIGTVPRAVRETREARLKLCESNPWLYVWSGLWDEDDAKARAALAAFVGCTVGELAVTHNTTEGFNLLASGLPLGRGDEVLFSSLNHIGASECWRRWSRDKGYSVRRFDFPLDDAPGLSARDVVALHTRQIRDNTRVLVLPHIDNMVGLLHPVREIAASARAKGVEFVLLDAAQSVGMIDVNVTALGCDAIATSAHKWLQAPKGTGLLYVAPHLRDVLQPMWVTWGQSRWPDSARKFEDYGTRDPTLTMALGDAAVLHARTPFLERAAHLAALRQHLMTRVDAESSLHWRSPRDRALGASLVGVQMKGVKSSAVFAKMREHGFIFRPFDQDDYTALRISMNMVNTMDEIDRFFKSLGEAGFLRS